MFHQDNQSTVALTLEYTHSYDILHATGPMTTASTWSSKVTSIKQLRREFCDLSNDAEDLQEKLDATGKKNSQAIMVKVNGTINGVTFTDYQIDGLENFRDFIINHKTIQQKSSPRP